MLRRYDDDDDDEEQSPGEEEQVQDEQGSEEEKETDDEVTGSTPKRSHRRSAFMEQDDDDDDDEEGEQEDEEVSGSSRKRKHRRSGFVDDVAEEEEEEEDDEDEDEEDEEEDEEYENPRKKKMRRASAFIDDTADVASDDEEEEEDGEEGGGEADFINDTGPEVEERDTRLHRRSRVAVDEEDEEDLEDLERQILERYGPRTDQVEYGDDDEDTGEVEQQANLPSVRDPKLWMVKCAAGFEREIACCLMQKFLDLQSRGTDLQITSAIALDHLKGYLYVEAHKEAHVKQACKGLRNLYLTTVKLVPITEMTDVLTVDAKSTELGKETWIRVKSGIYKGDLAKIVDIDNMRQRVTVKIVPRLDLQAMKKRMEGFVTDKKEKKRAANIAPSARLFNLREIKDMGIMVERKRDPVTGEVFESVDNLMFKDGYLYKILSLKSVNSQNIKPSFDELQQFQSDDGADSDMVAGMTKKRHFMKGDAVVVISGDLKNLKGCVEKVEDDNIHVKPQMKGIDVTLLVFKQNELCKFFETGDHVKVLSGRHEGISGMIVKVEKNNVLVIIADRSREDITVFADNVVECKQEASGLTKLGEYELHDFVQLDRNNFGVITSVEKDGFQILKAVPERSNVVSVKLRDISKKIFDRNFRAEDQYRNSVGLRDVMKILEGPFKGKQGPVEHMNRGIVFIRDTHCVENGGFVCAKARSCVAVAGTRGPAESAVNRETASSTSGGFRPPQHGGRGMAGRGGRQGGRGRGREDPLVGTSVKIRVGEYKGYRGRVVGVQGPSVRIELESQMKVVAVRRDHLADAFANANTYSTTCGGETPVHSSQTPMRPYMTPIRDSAYDPSATPMHDGMRTPVVGPAWNAWEIETPMTSPGS